MRNLNSKTDPAVLAREVVEKCDLIHKSQISDVEQIIYYLKNRKDDSNMTTSLKSASVRSHSQHPPDKHSSSETEKASIRNIEEYIELLYEELPERIRGSALILQLARNPDNLEELEKNGSLISFKKKYDSNFNFNFLEAVLSALSRVLREDWRKSLDLSTNIIYTFFCFSTYSHFHPVIVNYKIGSLCMDVIDHELKRYDQTKTDLDHRKNPDNKDKEKEKEKTADNVDITLMNEEKPKDVSSFLLLKLSNFFKFYLNFRWNPLDVEFPN